MSAIKKIVRTEGNELHLVLPDEFKDQEVDIEVSLHKVEKDEIKNKEQTTEEWRASLLAFYSQYSVDLSNNKFNRDELYDRDDRG